MRNIEARLKKAESATAGSVSSQLALIKAERAVLFRTRLEGCGVWSHCGGHVLAYLNGPINRQVYFALLAKLDERTRKQVMKSLNHCIADDPFMLDANYPLLEYILSLVVYWLWRPFVLAVPVRIIDWICSTKPEEYLHYRPRDWCVECGYRYPGLVSQSHDLRTFLLTRYAEEQLAEMERPFEGKACLLCGGEIMNGNSMGEYSTQWQSSPAFAHYEQNLPKWISEVEAVQVLDSFNHPYLEDEKNTSVWLDKAEAHFMERRARQNGFIYEPHRVIAESMAHYFMD